MQRYVAKNEGAVYYHRPYLIDVTDKGGSLLLTFSDYDARYHIHCEEEQLTSLLRNKDAPNGDWLVFFSVTDFSRPLLSVYAEFIDAFDVEILLEENEVMMVPVTLRGSKKLISSLQLLPVLFLPIAQRVFGGLRLRRLSQPGNSGKTEP
jgi:hypothetical protein